MKTEEKTEEVKHLNIFAALAAFQAENPEIKRTKNVEFLAKGQKVSFWYAPLDEVLQTVRPIAGKHGLSITWEDKDGKMVCAVYHETYQSYPQVVSKSNGEEVAEMWEKNVIRSMPITVRRIGDMKDIGTDSTYARRYTLAEVLGVASDEDRDVEIEEARKENIEKFAFSQAKKQILSAKTYKELEEKKKFFGEEVQLLDSGKSSKLGFTMDQYIELARLCNEREDEISKVGRKDIEVE